MNKHKDKIVVIGAGNVGEAIAYTLMARVQANDIVLIDVNEDRAKGAALDIAHGTSFFKQVWVRSGGYEECEDARAREKQLLADYKAENGSYPLANWRG